MRLLARIVIVLTAMLLATLVYCLVITQGLASAKAVSDKLESSGVYALGSDALQTSLIASLTAANIPEPVASRVVQLSVTPKSVKTAAQPALTTATDWLKSTSKSPLTANLDLSGIKAQIVRQAKLSGSAEVGFVATREVKDELPLVDTTLSKRLMGAKEGYQRAVEVIPTLAIAILAGLIILILLAIRQPSKRISWPAWVLLLAGGIILFLMYGVPFVVSLTVPKQSSPMDTIPVDLTRALVEDTRVYGYALVLLASVLLVLSAVVSRQDKKKEKKRR